jgi:pimeloyl-ACP methyl ester carboxylesterase
MHNRIALTAGIVVAALAFNWPACAESSAELIERFRAECIAHSTPRGEMRDCVMAKMRPALREIALRPGSGPPLQLLEGTPWLINNKGPAGAKGVIYFVRGWTPAKSNLDHFKLPPYFVKSLNDAGWDVVSAKIPHNLPDQGEAPGRFLALRAAPFVRGRIKDLKAQGYAKVVFFGHSWGGWVGMLVAAANPDVDVLIQSAPGVFGRRVFNGGENSNFRLNLSQFGPDLAAVKTPTVLITIANDEFDPGGRAQIAAKHFAGLNVPHLLIDKPAGFSGHVAAYLPFFDYAFGRCLAAFLDKPTSEPCRLPPIVNDDFRSILDIKQVPDADAKRIGSADALIGKTFDCWGLDAESRRYRFISVRERVRMLCCSAETHEGISLREGILCAGNTCSKLVKWSEGQLLEFDAKTGQLKAWWIEDQ